MTNRKSSKSADYTVGYRRPPKATQFAPGESGNPKGRPKGNRSIGSLLKDILEQKVPVTEQGKSRRRSVCDVVFRRLANDAMRGDLRAIKVLIWMWDRYGGSPEKSLETRELLDEDAKILARYLREATSPQSAKDDAGGDDDR